MDNKFQIKNQLWRQKLQILDKLDSILLEHIGTWKNQFLRINFASSKNDMHVFLQQEWINHGESPWFCKSYITFTKFRCNFTNLTKKPNIYSEGWKTLSFLSLKSFMCHIIQTVFWESKIKISESIILKENSNNTYRARDMLLSNFSESSKNIVITSITKSGLLSSCSFWSWLNWSSR